MRKFSSCTVLTALGLTLAVGTAHAQIVRKVMIIGVDGMRPDAMLAANCPNFDALIARGAFSQVCQAEDITISGPGWSSITTGVHRLKHNVVDNSFTSPNYTAYPHFFKRLNETCSASTASIVQWGPINTQICQDNADLSVTGVAGAAVASSCIDLLNTGNPDVIFLHFDDVDHAGHAYGFSPTVPQYLAAIEGVDALAGQVLSAVAARPAAANEDWLIIVTSDHGGTPDGSHGRNIPEHRNTGLIVSGRSAAAGTTITPAPAIVDVPATVMTFLGLAINPAWGWDGRAVGLNMAGSPSQPFACAPPPPPAIGACCLPAGECQLLTLPQCDQLRGSWAGLGTACDPEGCAPSLVLLSEDFESVALGPNVDETLAGTNVWSATPPAGWSIDRTGVPSGGVTEWRGWNIASRSWWSDAAGNQNRSLFTKGIGAVAVADPDEWSDLA
ncbi:MAG: alkaline phosphatase family protein, partial [Planctomycetota bacterium]|nr:alkaline phosphatase family protein [Planctomycetota bacterium]